MRLDRFTVKAQQSVQKAFETAQRLEHQAVEPEHLLRGLLSENESVMRFLFQKMGVNAMRSWRACRACRAASSP